MRSKLHGKGNGRQEVRELLMKRRVKRREEVRKVQGGQPAGLGGRERRLDERG